MMDYEKELREMRERNKFEFIMDVSVLAAGLLIIFVIFIL